jgi:transcriptional regulator with XRE-family HTH domain
MYAFDGQALAEARKKAKLSQRKLARLVGISSSAVCRLESGCRIPSLKLLFKLAEHTGTQPARFISSVKDDGGRSPGKRRS